VLTLPEERTISFYMCYYIWRVSIMPSSYLFSLDLLITPARHELDVHSNSSPASLAELTD
jgi:hypothetical protein